MLVESFAGPCQKVYSKGLDVTARGFPPPPGKTAGTSRGWCAVEGKAVGKLAVGAGGRCGQAREAVTAEPLRCPGSARADQTVVEAKLPLKLAVSAGFAVGRGGVFTA